MDTLLQSVDFCLASLGIVRSNLACGRGREGQVSQVTLPQLPQPADCLGHSGGNPCSLLLPAGESTESVLSQPSPGLVETVVALSVLAAGTSGVGLREECGDWAWKRGHLELLTREAVRQGGSWVEGASQKHLPAAPCTCGVTQTSYLNFLD